MVIWTISLAGFLYFAQHTSEDTSKTSEDTNKKVVEVLENTDNYSKNWFTNKYCSENWFKNKEYCWGDCNSCNTPEEEWICKKCTY